MTSKFVVPLCLGLLFAASSSGIANAQQVCAPALALPSVVQTRAYDPFDQHPLIEDAVLSFRDAACNDPITISATIGWGTAQPRLAFDGHQLGFSIAIAGTDLTSGQSVLGEVNAPINGVSLSLPPGSSGDLAQSARFIIPEGQIVPPGMYSLLVPAISQSASGLLTQAQGGTETQATPITISTQVLAVLKLGVTGCDLSSDSVAQNSGLDLASGCTLNLGDPAIGMVNGDARRARINARANVNFKVAMVSRNGGMLKLAGGRGDARATEEIHYSATLEGQGQNSSFTCNTSNCGSSDVVEPTTSPLGTDLYFQVKVSEPDISQKRAGIYTDTITLIIQPAS